MLQATGSHRVGTRRSHWTELKGATRASQGASGKEPPHRYRWTGETRASSLGGEDPLEEG